VVLSVSPAQATIFTSQTHQYTAALTGATDTSVVWSINPAVGSISTSGLYTAPLTLSSPQTVTVTATSNADPSTSASTNITVNPAITISLSPANVQLFASQSQQFTAAVTGTANTAVTWSLRPAIGTLNKGMYVAPAALNSQQTVTVTATSTASPSQTASATITLVPVVAVAITPTSVSLTSGQSSQFNASITGTTNTAATWSVAPAVGTVVNGLYTAPATITTPQNVTLTAASITDPTKTALATITLMPPSPITMPIEVVGPAGTTETVTVPLPSGVDLSATQLWMQIHGLRYADKASVQVNNAPWVGIDDNTVTLQGLANAYGGVGGGFTTLKMTLNLPPGTLVAGNNSVGFRFNATGGGLGFRVLKFNFVQPDGTMLLPANLFVDDDPNTWQPPLTSSGDIAAGKELFQTASILHAGAPVLAHCNDCHTQDGRDLHYFNYSNKFLHYGAVISGLTDNQADQIASYIRTLNVPNPGRPWNPPYQPGPGLDSQPVENWAAGAGLDAVLDSDSAMLATLFPNGVQASFFSPNGTLNPRETQIALPLPDWNGWLPHVNPKDMWPDFVSSAFFYRYGKIRADLTPGGSAAYSSALPDMSVWESDEQLFMGSKTSSNLSPATWTPSYNTGVYSTLQWAMVKSWEINHEFGLEGLGRIPFPSARDDARAWFSGFPFLASPNMLHVPSVAPTGLDNGSLSTREYLAFVWYQTQLILNHNDQQGNAPIDWGYVYQFIKGLSATDSQPQSALLSFWLAESIQIENNGIGPDQVDTGWNWNAADISRAVSPGYRTIWVGTPAATRTALMTGMAQGWLTEVQQFTPQQFWTGGQVSTRLPVHGQPDSSQFEDRVWYLIPQFAYRGVNQTLINQLAAWAQTIWPNANWAATTTATCVPDGADPTFARCSTEY
jgi:cytochrome c553